MSVLDTKRIRRVLTRRTIVVSAVLSGLLLIGVAGMRLFTGDGDVYAIGDGVSAPMLTYKVEPEYSEEAREAKYQGTVVLSIVIDENGLAQDIQVVRPLGLGLDEKAIEAVEQWLFQPGRKDGRPVRVAATVEIKFRLT